MLEKFLSMLSPRKAPEPEAPPHAADENRAPEAAGIAAAESGKPADSPFDARVIDTGVATSNDVVTSLLDIETYGKRSNAVELRLRFLKRHPVLDRSQHIVGYELYLRSKPELPAKKKDETLLLMYDQMLVKSILDLGAEHLLRGKLAFISISAPMLEHAMIERLPREGIVLAVQPDLARADRMLARCQQLKEMGYQLAMENFAYSPELIPFLKVADFLRFDISKADALGLGKQLVEILKVTVRPLIALGVETEEHFEYCRQLAFQYYEGYYFTMPQPTAPHRFSNQRVKVVELLNLVREHAEIRELEESFKRDAALTLKLLRYINSAANGLVTQVRSISHALTILGYDQLYRWLTLLLFASEKLDVRSQALLKNALVRARLTELLGREHVPTADRDGLFIVGVFSTLDALLNAPMETVLKQFKLSPQVEAALMKREGIYAPFLELAIACEKFDQERIDELAAACKLDADKVNLAHIKALIWAEETEK